MAFSSPPTIRWCAGDQRWKNCSVLVTPARRLGCRRSSRIEDVLAADHGAGEVLGLQIWTVQPDQYDDLAAVDRVPTT